MYWVIGIIILLVLYGGFNKEANVSDNTQGNGDYDDDCDDYMED